MRKWLTLIVEAKYNYMPYTVTPYAVRIGLPRKYFRMYGGRCFRVGLLLAPCMVRSCDPSVTYVLY